MPLLPPEPFVFPDDLLLQSGVCSDDEVRWWVLHTRPRAEKALARQILTRAIPFFLPLHQRQWRNRGRLFSSYLPLFPGYLFVHGSADAPQTALQTNQVARVIPVPDQTRFFADLQRVYQLMQSGLPLTPEERLEPGTLVEITSGPFAGMEGTILRRGTKLRFLVEVKFLKTGVSVEMDGCMFQPVIASRARETASAALA
jgi:transcriptional antiterminator RfaH